MAGPQLPGAGPAQISNQWLSWLRRQQAATAGTPPPGSPVAMPGGNLADGQQKLIDGVLADQEADNNPSSLANGVMADQLADNPLDGGPGANQPPPGPMPDPTVAGPAAPGGPPSGGPPPTEGGNNLPGFQQLPGPPVAGTPGAPADPSKSPMDRTRSIYQQRQGEQPNQWAQRVMETSGADFGPAGLNPDSSANAFADSPYSRWNQQQYGQSAPFDALLSMLLSGSGGQEPTSVVEGNMQNFQQGGGLHQAQTQGGARDKLAEVQKLLDQFIADPAGSFEDDPGRKNALASMAGSPQLGAQLILSQLQNLTGGYGGNALGGMIGDMAKRYSNDVVGEDPSKMGTFYAKARKMAGLG